MSSIRCVGGYLLPFVSSLFITISGWVETTLLSVELYSNQCLYTLEQKRADGKRLEAKSLRLFRGLEIEVTRRRHAEIATAALTAGVASGTNVFTSRLFEEVSPAHYKSGWGKSAEGRSHNPVIPESVSTYGTLRPVRSQQ